jgi:hypothetical protein
VCKRGILGDTLGLHMSRYYTLKFPDRPFKSYDFLKVRSIDVKIFLPVTPDGD